MRNIGLIFEAQCVRQLGSRAFLLGTVLGALGFALLAVFPVLVDQTLGEGTKRIVLAGSPALTARAASLLAKDYDVVAVVAAPPARPSVDFLDAHDEAGALVELAAEHDRLTVTLYARDVGIVRGDLATDLVPLNIALATRLPQARIDRLLAVPVEVKSLEARFASRAAAKTLQGIALAMVAILYFATLLNAQSVLSSVAEEKTSRIAELLVSIVSPAELLAGKILATTATGSLQVAVWVATAYAAAPLVASLYGDPATLTPGATRLTLFSVLAAVGPAVVVAFAVLFVVGVLQYGLLYAGAASLMSRQEDRGAVVGPLIVPILVGYFAAQVAVVSPHAPAVVAISLVPILSPFVLLARIVVATTPAWQIVLSLVLDVAAIAASALLVGKLYRVGLLSYGKPPSLAQVWTILRG